MSMQGHPRNQRRAVAAALAFVLAMSTAPAAWANSIATTLASANSNPLGLERDIDSIQGTRGQVSSVVSSVINNGTVLNQPGGVPVGQQHGQASSFASATEGVLRVRGDAHADAP